MVDYLNGKVALITGSSRGIGRAIALRLARRGARIVLNYRKNVEEAEGVLKEIMALGSDVITVKADVSLESSVVDLIEQATKQWGRIDILVNNAGIIKDRLMLRMDPNDWDEVINTNLRGTYLCTHSVLPIMVRQRYGRIINICSVVGMVGNPGQANYAASKAGVIALTKSLAKEVASRNITVNALSPGYIATEIVEHLPDKIKEKILARIPMGKFGTPDDIAGTADFLCSPDADYLTGQVIVVDGGLM